MNRIPFGNQGQHPGAASTPRILGSRDPRIQSQPRFRFAEWQRRGVLPDGLSPATLAHGFRRAHGGLEPPRDPQRPGTRAYSELEVALALAALGALSAPDPAAQLERVWAAVLQRLELPSTRMLLLQRGRLARVFDRAALVQVEANWLPLMRSRLRWLHRAFEAELGYPFAVILAGGLEVGQ